MMRALLLSAYHATSHARWARGLTGTFDEYDWTVVTLPPRHFRWRARGNALWWALEEPAVQEPYDLVVATSTVDLAALLGLVPTLHDAHVVLYFHENQFEYPTRDGELDVALAVTDLYSALAADRVVYNSEFNRSTMLEGIDALMSLLPDYTPTSARAAVEQRSAVVPVGLEDVWFVDEKPARTGPMRIVWNHRWEYDKAPDRFFAALDELHASGVEFVVDVVGQQFRTVPAAFEEGRLRHTERIDQWGFVDSVQEYRQLLRRADVVVSTALHEFQGLAVLEAAASGALPVVPDRLAYPEFLPHFCLYDGSLEDERRDASRLAEHLGHVAARVGEHRAADPIDVSELRWAALRPRYEGVFDADDGPRA